MSSLQYGACHLSITRFSGHCCVQFLSSPLQPPWPGRAPLYILLLLSLDFSRPAPTFRPLKLLEMGSKSIHYISLFQRFFCFPVIFLLILGSTQVIRFKAEAARTNPKSGGIDDQTQRSAGAAAEEEKTLLRAQIGSRPPRCERRCSWCEHCEAIQVPTNPQVHGGNRKSSAEEMSKEAYDRGGEDNYPNYKPMSWKCKCGDLIFNP